MSEEMIIPTPVDISESAAALNCDRLTAQLSVYHEHCGDDPIAVNSHFSNPLETVCQPLSRRLTVSNKWQCINPQWVEQVGYIVIENRVGKDKSLRRSKEQIEADKGRILQIRCAENVPGWLVHPGHFFMAYPENIHTLQMRAALGVVDIQLVVMPK